MNEPERRAPRASEGHAASVESRSTLCRPIVDVHILHSMLENWIVVCTFHIQFVARCALVREYSGQQSCGTIVHISHSVCSTLCLCERMLGPTIVCGSAHADHVSLDWCDQSMQRSARADEANMIKKHNGLRSKHTTVVVGHAAVGLIPKMPPPPVFWF